MELAENPNSRRRVDAEAQRRRDIDVVRMRRDGMPFRTIARCLDLSLGAVQNSVHRAQELADVLATENSSALLAASCDDEMTTADVTCVADISKIGDLERYRLRHMPGPFGDVERAVPIGARSTQ